MPNCPRFLKKYLGPKCSYCTEGTFQARPRVYLTKEEEAALSKFRPLSYNYDNAKRPR